MTKSQKVDKSVLAISKSPTQTCCPVAKIKVRVQNSNWISENDAFAVKAKDDCQTILYLLITELNL
jgi:hypothetical protein